MAMGSPREENGVSGLSLRGYKKFVIGGSLAAVSIQAAGAGVGFLLNVFVARVINPAAFGLYSYALSWASIIALVACVGLDAATLRFAPAYLVNNEWGKLRGFLGWSRTWVVTLSVLIVLALELAIHFLSSDTAKWSAVQIGLLLVPFMSFLALGQSVLRSFKAVVWSLVPNSLIRPVLAIVFVGAIVVFWKDSRNASQMLAALIIATVLAALVQYLFIVKRAREIPQAGREHSRSEWIRTSVPMLFMNGSFVLLSQLDLIMLGTLGTAQDTGYYSAAMRFTVLVSLATAASNIVVAPIISETYYGGRPQELRAIIRFVSLVVGAVSTTAFVGFLIFGKWLLGFFGPSYEVAYFPALILMITQVLSAWAGPNAHVLFLTGRQNTAVVVYACACVVAVLINFYAIPVWGMYGAALGAAVSMSLANLSLFWMGRHRVLGTVAG